MIREIIMPQLGQTMEEGVINKWLKKEGDKVEKGEVVLEVATDKANLDVESFYKGYLRKILYPEGTTVPVTKVIALITDKPDEEIPEDYIEKIMKGEKKEEKVEQPVEEKVEVKAEEPRVRGKGEIKASPLAKKLAREKNIDLTKVKGTGPGGRITKEDVLEFLERGEKEGEELVFTRVREITAERMEESKKTVPHFYLGIEANMKKALELKNREEIGLSAVIFKALALSLKEHPWLRSKREGRKVEVRNSIDINIAIDTPDGLYAPIMRRVDEKNLKEINNKIKELANKAKEGKLGLDELEIGIFTFSNLGMFHVDSFSAIIIPGQAGIMATGEVKEKVFVKDGMIGVSPFMQVIVSFDHRIVDGATGARFLKTFREIIEEGNLE